MAKDSIQKNKTVVGSTNSSQVRKSRYNHSGTGPTSSTGRFLDFYERIFIDPADDDSIFIIPLAMEGRADKISNLFYSSPRYMWVILMRNQIDDPFSELLAGNRLFIPSITRLYSEILK